MSKEELDQAKQKYEMLAVERNTITERAWAAYVEYQQVLLASLVEEGIIGDIVWVPDREDNTFWVTLFAKKGEATHKLVSAMSQSDTQHCEVENIKLHRDTDVVYLHGTTQEMKAFVKKYKLQVDLESVDTRIEEFQAYRTMLLDVKGGE